MIDKRLLLIDDDENFREVLSEELSLEGFIVIQASSIKNVKKDNYAFAILDLRLKGEYGLNHIETLLQWNPDCQILILSGYSSISSAVEAVKLGAVNYLIKPASIEQIISALCNEQLKQEKDPEAPPTLSSVEHEYIEFVLAQNKGNISKAAKVLGLHRQSLQRKLKKYK